MFPDDDTHQAHATGSNTGLALGALKFDTAALSPEQKRFKVAGIESDLELGTAFKGPRQRKHAVG